MNYVVIFFLRRIMDCDVFMKMGDKPVIRELFMWRSIAEDNRVRNN